MATIRFDLNEHYNTLLQENAKNMNMSIQDYIRHKLFDIQTIFTVAEAIKRIQNGNFSNPVKYPDGFTLPDVYGNDWTIQHGAAGVFGKEFYKYINDNPSLGITFINMGKNGRLAHYKLSIFTVAEAIKRIQNGNFSDPVKYPDGFTLPDVYGNDWTIQHGAAGVFGKEFYKYINDNPSLGITFKEIGQKDKLAHYVF